MHSSRMRTVRCSGRRGGGVVSARGVCEGVCLWGGGVCPGSVKIQNIQVLLASEPRGNIIRSLERLWGGGVQWSQIRNHNCSCQKILKVKK